MWPPKRWEIESGHIRISSWVQGERRRRRREYEMHYRSTNGAEEKENHFSMILKALSASERTQAGKSFVWGLNGHLLIVGTVLLHGQCER
jgi:hypothetical protein